MNFLSYLYSISSSGKYPFLQHIQSLALKNNHPVCVFGSVCYVTAQTIHPIFFLFLILQVVPPPLILQDYLHPTLKRIVNCTLLHAGFDNIKADAKVE